MNAIGSVGWICGVCGASNHPDNKVCALSCHQAVQKQGNLTKVDPALKYQPYDHELEKMMGGQNDFVNKGLAQAIRGDQPINHDQESRIGGNKYQVPVGGFNEYGEQNDFS